MSTIYVVRADPITERELLDSRDAYATRRLTVGCIIPSCDRADHTGAILGSPVTGAHVLGSHASGVAGPDLLFEAAGETITEATAIRRLEEETASSHIPTPQVSGMPATDHPRLEVLQT